MAGNKNQLSQIGDSGKSVCAAIPAIKRQLLLSTALAVPALLGYGNRQAYAACVNSGGSTYLCSGNETTTQIINVDNAALTMDTGATVDTSGGAGNAITITGDGDLSFTNLVGGAINGAARGLDINAGNGLPAGSITVNTTQSVTGGTTGIFARNDGIGALTVTAANVTGTAGRGISARNQNAAGTGDLTITTTGTVSGSTDGISAYNRGTGVLTVNAADVTGTTARGIYARNQSTASTDLTVTTTGTVSGATDGIYALNLGTGAVIVNAADVTGTAGRGIYAQNSNAASTDLTVTATGTVSGATNGIIARNFGTGALTVNAANVTGTAGRGIYARSLAGGSVITVSGAVTGTSDGIGVRGTGSNVINVAAGATVTGGTNAINTTIGAIGSNDTVNNLAGGTITGNLVTGGGNDTFANDGTFTGNANLGEGNNIVTNTSLLSFTGDLTTGAGNDTVTNTGAWTGNVDLGGGTNVFNNNAGGILNSLATFNLGAGNALTNAGTLSPGGTGTVQTTALTGNFVQTAAGTFAVDVDQSVPVADLLTVTGTASLAGSVVPNLLSAVNATGQVDIVTAAGGVTDNGLGVSDTVAADYTLLFPDANTVALGFVIDFAPQQLPNTGLTPQPGGGGE